MTVGKLVTDYINISSSDLTVNNGSVSVVDSLVLEESSSVSSKAIDVPNQIIVGSGSTLTHAAASTAGLNITATNLTIEAGGSINVNYNGYVGGWGSDNGGGEGGGTGSTNYNGGGGAGYGGAGGTGEGNYAGGTAYGSLTKPGDLGSGGGGGRTGTAGTAYKGGDGGGLVFINVTNTLNVSGTISANGNSGAGTSTEGGGSGSGGSVYLTAGTFTGSGTITANGGSGYSVYGGGGAGGRIAVYYTTNSFSGITNASFGTGYQNGSLGAVYRCEGISGVNCSGVSGSTSLATNGTIELRTEYTINTSLEVNKTITNINQDNLKWNDSSSNASCVAIYNITGLVASTDYYIYNNSVEISESPLQADGSGNLALFNVTLGSEHKIEVTGTSPNTAPTITANVTKPDNVYTNTDWMLNLTVTDPDSGDNLTAYTEFYVNSSSVGSVYSLNVTNGTNTNVDNLSTSEFNKGATLIAEFWAGDETENTTKYNTTEITVLNSLPSQVNLSYPENNDSFFTNRTPRFNWTAATDADDDILVYQFQLSIHSDVSSPLIDEENMSNLYYDQQTELDFDTYYWKVRANDSEGAGVWSDIWNFTLTPSVSIVFVNDSISFGSMELNEINDTTNDAPKPFILEHMGNTEANVSIKATSLWSSASAPLNTSYFQFKADNSTETNSFDWLNSQTIWSDMSDIYKEIIGKFNYSDSNDLAEIEIRVKVPLDEIPVQKSSIITVYGIES
ncbi:hypothetical protein AUJ83_05070 [Candidatus Woesearchaeota archaeon CG1_02_33_12]|nr:MAG: hypothetical protein AUJ83_05070 [Candidatus Woesearchaeota archaeon CG1_02_33_12]